MPGSYLSATNSKGSISSSLGSPGTGNVTRPISLAVGSVIQVSAESRVRLANVNSPLQYSDHQRAQGRAFFDKACGLSLEGIVSKRADTPYTPG